MPQTPIDHSLQELSTEPGVFASDALRESVSVVATVRNEALTVGRFLDALLTQTRPPDEIVIVDGGSSDGTVEVVERYRQGEPRLRIHHEPGASISRGRNHAIERAAGPIIAVTDAGTVAAPDWLEKLVHPLETDRDTGVSAGFFVAGGRTWFERTLSTLITTQVHEVDPDRFLPSSRSVAFRKEWWERVGGYPEWLAHGEDVVFDLDLRKAGAKFVFAPEAVVTWYSRATLPQYFRQYFNYGRAEGRGAIYVNRNAARYGAYAMGVFLLRRVRRDPRLLPVAAAAVGVHFARFYRRLWRRPPADTPLGTLAAHAVAPVVIVVGDVAKMLAFPVGVSQRLRANVAGARSAGTAEIVGACAVCGGPLRPWREVDAGEPSDSRTYVLLRCDVCGSAETAGEPPPEDAYEKGMYVPPGRFAPLIQGLQRAAMRQPVHMLRRGGLLRGGRVLDVGAGHGRLVAALRRAGFDAHGIEPSRLGASIGADRGLPIVRSSLDEHTDSELDAAVLWHVLEHVDDPVAALRRVHGWLRPDGLLLVGVPNVESAQARVGGRGWLHLDAPRHRLHLTPKGLTLALERSGFEVLEIKHAIWQQNPLGMWLAMLSRAGLRANLPLHAVKRNVAVTRPEAVLLAAGVALVPLAVGTELVAAVRGRGGTVACLARAVDDRGATGSRGSS